MIYTKKANFPYPILMNFTDDYIDPEFELDVNIKDNMKEFILEIGWKISSKFIKNLIKKEKASLILIIKSRDNQFYKLNNKQHLQIEIPKRKLSINARTVMQLMIQVNEDMDYSKNDDLNSFYNEIKSQIHIQTGNVLGFSNTVIFDGSQNKPFDLFERKIDKNIKSDMEFRLGNETIIIVYRDEQFQFKEMPNSKELNYPYIYMGLQKALMSFILHENNNIDEEILIDEMEPPENPLESKLYNLMKSKNITELSVDNIDEVIYQISDNLIMRYQDVVRGLFNAG